MFEPTAEENAAWAMLRAAVLRMQTRPSAAAQLAVDRAERALVMAMTGIAPDPEQQQEQVA